MSQQSRNNPSEPKPSSQSIRSAIWVICLFGVLAASAGIWLATRKSNTPPVQANNSQPASEISDSAANASIGRTKPVEPVTPLVERELEAGLPPAVQSTPAPPPPRKPASKWPEASPYTRQIIANLTQLDPKNGPMTPEQVALWKQNLQALLQQGGAAVPAIMEFLDRNVDLNLKSLAGDQLGSSLRNAMFDALAQIGGADGVAGLAQVLQSTADPREIAHLASMLDVQGSEEYRSAVVDAAREALAHLANKKIEGVDVAPLFELMQKYGGPEVITDLEIAAKKWNYYAPLALANLPDGTGIPALANMVRDRNTAASSGGVMALRMLAQNAFKYPEARGALLNAAEANHIPSSAWLGIAEELAGKYAYYGSAPADLGAPPKNIGGKQTYHISSGNQSFGAQPRRLTPEETQQSIEMLEALRKSPSPSPLKEMQINQALRYLTSQAGQ